MPTTSQIDVLLSTLNAAEVGTLESISAKLRQVHGELLDMEQLELASKAAEALSALERGDVSEFQRGRAYLQSKIGHLR